MKKSKVDRLIKRFKADAYEAGRKQGRAEERDRHEQRILFDSRGERHMWIGDRPKSERIVVMAQPDAARVMPLDGYHHVSPGMLNASRIEFELEICAINFSNGMAFRWANWKPRGPYPVTKLAEMPRFG